MSKKVFSINGIARLFAKDRASIYAWVMRGCPCIDATKPGLAAQLNFKEVLAWRKAYMAQHRWPDESIAEMETAVRERLKVLKKGDRHGTT